MVLINNDKTKRLQRENRWKKILVGHANNDLLNGTPPAQESMQYSRGQ